MVAQRAEIQEKEYSSIGIGAVYLRTLKQVFPGFDPTINIMVNYKCHGKCRHCLALDLIDFQQTQTSHLKPEEVQVNEERKRRNLMQTMTDFKGSPRAFLTGGEPFAEGPEIFSLIQYAAKCFDEVYINTNALAIPLDERKAVAFFGKIPSNVTFSISLDQYHAEIDPHLKERVALCETLSQRGLCRTAYNVRILKSGALRPSKVWEILEEYGLESRYEENRNDFFIHEIKAASAAINLGEASSMPLDPFDFIKHTKDPNEVTMFITPEGQFLNSDHAAFMVPPRPAMSIVGNIFEEGTERVLRRLIKSYFNFFRNSAVYIEFQQLLSERNSAHDRKTFNGIRRGLEFDSPETAAVARLVLKAPKNIRWEIPFGAPYSDFICALPKRKRAKLFSDCVDQYLACFEQDKLPADAWCGNHRIIVDQQQPKFVYKGKYEKSISISRDSVYDWHDQIRYLLEFGRILGKGREDFFGLLCKRLSLTKPPQSLEELLANIWVRYYQKEVKESEALTKEVQRALSGLPPEETQLYPGDRLQASNWFKSL